MFLTREFVEAFDLQPFRGLVLAEALMGINMSGLIGRVVQWNLRPNREATSSPRLVESPPAA
jgi:hypothetical protein